jgi:hypothetical protein
MRESAFEAIRLMPRDELESFAVRAALQLRSDRGAIKSENAFLTVLIGFLLGAIVAASGFLLGVGLG